MEHSSTPPAALSLRQALWAMTGICLVVMLVALDQTVVGTALPRVVAELRGFEWYAWVASSYLLTSAICVPVTGRLGDMYGRKPFVLGAIVTFTAASALCGMANSMLELVLARGLQGIGGGMLMGAAFASVVDIFPDTRERIRWQVMISSTFGIASALGPMLGGFLTEHLGWRSVFYVNLPVGLVALGVVLRCLPRHPGHRQPGDRIDWQGAVLLSATLAVLLLTLENAARLGAANPLLWGALILALALATGFVRSQRRAATPLLPLGLFALPTVRRLSILSLLAGCAMFVLIFYAPLLLQGGFERSPKLTGLLVTPLVVCITVGSIINGRLLARLARGHLLLSWGMLGLGAGCVAVALLSAGNSDATIMAVFAFCGLSLGFQLPNLTLQMQAAVPRRDVGTGSALVQTVRTLGSMLGASLAGIAVNTVYHAKVVAALPPHADPRLTAALTDPQILVRSADQRSLAELAHGLDVSALIGTARLGLAGGIQMAVGACVALTLIGFWIGRKLPPLTH